MPEFVTSPDLYRPEPIPVWGIVDNTNPDNEFQVMTLLSSYFDLQGVIVTGRAAAADKLAALDNISKEESEFRTVLNAVRMRNFMREIAPNREIPVFAGTPAPETIVPHRIHVDELDYEDLYEGQLEAIRGISLRSQQELGRLGLAGNIATAISYMKSAEMDDFVMVVGGPMTDVDKLLRHGAIREKTTEIHTQFGMCGFGEHKLMELDEKAPRGKRQFNVACDVRAAQRVLMNFPRDIHLYPSDVTRVNDIGFADAQALERFLPRNAGTDRIVQIYDYAFREMIKPRGPHEMIWIHDVAPAIGALNLPSHKRAPTGKETEFIRGPYTQRPAHIRHVPYKPSERANFGEIWFSFIEDAVEIPDSARRWVADSVDPELYRRAVYELSI